MLDFFFLKMAFVHFPQKDWHSSNQTMSSSFSFAAQLHRKGMLKKKKKKKLSLIQEMSSRVHATSNEQILVN